MSEIFASNEFCRTCLDRETALMSVFSEVSQEDWKIEIHEMLQWFANIEVCIAI